MFSVYGVSGQTFRGTLEALPAVPGLTRARHVRGIGREGEELGREVPRLHPRELEETPYQRAAEAYREILQVPVERGPILHAYQLMTREVFTVRADETVEAVWFSLAERGLGQAPVLDRTHLLVGHISSHELLTVINLEDGRLRDVMSRRVADVMTTPVVSADPVTDIRRVARILLERHLPGMPVVTDMHELVGIITRSDILRALVNDPPLSLWA